MPADIPASATPPRSPTPSPTRAHRPTATALPLYFAYLIPTPTAFGAVDFAAEGGCEVAKDWLPYEVGEGDTLLSLAVAADSDLIALRQGNCFAPIRGVFAGERLLLPRLPAAAALPAPASSAADEAAVAQGCESPAAQIHSPMPLAQVEGVFAISGSALAPAGGRYQIAIKPRWADDYYLHLVSERAVSDGVLGLVNTEAFGAGLHRLRLSVRDAGGALIEGGACDLPVIFGER